MTVPVQGGHQFGPVDLYLLGLPHGHPDPAALASLTDLAGSGLLRVLDLILITRSDTGEVTIVEATEVPVGFEIDVAALGATGLIGHDDIDSLAAKIPEGTAALLIAVELVYQRELAAKAEESGAELLAYERIPAHVVNTLLDSLLLKGDG